MVPHQYPIAQVEFEYTFNTLEKQLEGDVNLIVEINPDNDQPERNTFNNTYIQPFVAYTTPTAWTFTLNSESSYSWRSSEWSVPVNGMVSKLVAIGGQKMQLQLGGRYWAESPTSGPEGAGVRAAITFLFPK